MTPKAMPRAHRALPRCFLAPLVMALISAAHAADWPSAGPIKLIVPAAAGSSPDYASRKLAAYLSTRIGQAVVVDNKPGAAGAIGMRALATSHPDGYTIGYANVATLAINPALFPALPYDAAKDFAPVIALTSVPNVVAVRSDLPVSTLPELIAYARSHPGGLTYGSGGSGTTSHLAVEMFKARSGLFIVHAPYVSAPQAVADLMAGRVDLMIENISALTGVIQAGKTRALAVTGHERSPILPGAPTMQEAGIGDFEVEAWGGIVAPAGTPAPIVARLNREVQGFVDDPTARKEFAQFSASMLGGSATDFSSLISKETVRWAGVVKRAGIKPD